MGIRFYLYRAPSDAGPMHTWSQMRAKPLGTVDEVRQRLTQLLPQVRWSPHTAATGGDPAAPSIWWGEGPDFDPYIDILLSPDEPGPMLYFVTLRKACPSLMRRIVHGLALTDVWADTGQWVDLDGYTDEDPYFATKPWPVS